MLFLFSSSNEYWLMSDWLIIWISILGKNAVAYTGGMVMFLVHFTRYNFSHFLEHKTFTNVIAWSFLNFLRLLFDTPIFLFFFSLNYTCVVKSFINFKYSATKVNFSWITPRQTFRTKQKIWLTIYVIGKLCAQITCVTFLWNISQSIFNVLCCQARKSTTKVILLNHYNSLIIILIIFVLNYTIN